MKKLLIALMCILCLSGCNVSNKETEDKKELTIVTPLGAPVLVFYDQMENENYTRVAANALGALWAGEQSPDVMVSDLTSGVQAIRNGAEYKLGAIVTFGNLYIASTGKDEDGAMSADDRIVLFGNENALPSRVFHYLFEDEFNESLIYENSATEAAAALASGKSSEGEEVDYVLLAQPAMFGALKKAKDNEMNAEIYLDIQKEYKDRSGYDFVQAALFINDRVDEETAKDFLRRLEVTVNAGIENNELVTQGLSIYEGEEAMVQYGFNPNVVLKVLAMENGLGNNAMGLGFKKALSIKNEIDSMLELFNIERTNEEIYIR